jgi:hypothetical protein
MEMQMVEQVITGGVRLAAYGNCVINNWIGSPGSKEFAAFDAYLSKVAAHHKEGIIFFVVLEPGAPILNAEQRKEMEAVYSRWGPSMRAAAQVVEGGNLWSLSARSVMTALRLVQRRSYPTKVFADVEEGAEWVAPYVVRPQNDNASGAPSGIIAEIQRLRSGRAA